MFHLLLLSTMLARGQNGEASDPWKASPAGEQALEFSPVTLNESCREQIFQRARRTVARRLLSPEHPPRLAAGLAGQQREAWAREFAQTAGPTAGGQHLNISSNQTLVIQRGSCLQISQHVTLDDLGWQSWVLLPSSFIFTECLGCPCHRQEEDIQLHFWSQECGLGQPSQGAQQRPCCRRQKTPLPFLFLREDGSLIIQTVRLIHGCHCRP